MSTFPIKDTISLSRILFLALLKENIESIKPLHTENLITDSVIDRVLIMMEGFLISQGKTINPEELTNYINSLKE
jgi:hypothetical protein